MPRNWFCVFLTAIPFLATPAMAGEYAVLSSGFRLHAQRHERDGDRVRVFSGNGVTELPAETVLRFEEEDYVPPPPVPLPALPEVPKAVRRADPKTLVRNAAIRSGLPPE